MFDEPVEHVVEKGFASLTEYLYKGDQHEARIMRAFEAEHPHVEKIKQE